MLALCPQQPQAFGHPCKRPFSGALLICKTEAAKEEAANGIQASGRKTVPPNPSLATHGPRPKYRAPIESATNCTAAGCGAALKGHASSADCTRPVLTHLLVEIRPGDFEI
jgi:hypothetical protein